MQTFPRACDNLHCTRNLSRAHCVPRGILLPLHREHQGSLGAVAALVVWIVATGASWAGDWPTWRHDELRSGVSADSLPSELRLQWERSLPAFDPAWPTEPRLRFDPTYEPVAAAGLLYVASPIDGSVTAYDITNGERRWQFFTEGPVRFAPVVAGHRIVVASDDGRLYCLDAKSGSPIWKVRVIGDDRPDLRQLGNDRLISCWPVRGGPVVHDHVVYVGCGLWPTMGVRVAAIDLDDGNVLWANSGIGSLDDIRVDHNTKADVGISPQGYCLFADNKLIVPSGRSMPARFDPHTGKMLYFVQGYRHGDARVIAAGSVLLVGRSGAVNLSDGREVGSRWVSAGKDAPQAWDGRKRDLFEGPFFPYKFTPGLDHRSVIRGTEAYGVDRGRLFGYDLTRVKTSLYKKKVGGQTVHPLRWEVARLWSPLPLAGNSNEPTYVSIQAGSRFYTHVGKTLVAVEIPAAADARKPRPRPHVVWRQPLPAVPRAMLAAENRLIVVLESGTVLCFGDAPTRVARHSPPASPLRDVQDDWSRIAKRLLKQTSSPIGYAVIWGIDGGRLVEEVLRQSHLHVIAIDRDADKVASLRRRLMRSGHYGTRAEVLVGDPATFRLPPYLASLVASEFPLTSSPLRDIPLDRLASMLRPYGGAAVVSVDDRDDAAVLVRQWKQQVDTTLQVQQDEKLVTVRRPDALPGAADWTHETSDAARTYFSRDERVQAPLAILWYGDGDDYGFHKWKDYGRGVKPQVCRGRLFAFNDRTRRLRAVDIYTGRRFWEYELPTSLVRFVSVPDAIYVAHGMNCDVLDPATGELLHQWTFHVPAAGGQHPGAVAVRADGDVLLIGVGFDLPTDASHPAIQKGLWNAKVLVAISRADGRQLWTRTATARFNLHAIAMGGGRVYCVDSTPPQEIERALRRGRSIEKLSSTVVCLDARTGDAIWQQSIETDRLRSFSWLSIRANDDWVAYNRKHDLLLTGKAGRMRAFDASSGKTRWPERPGGQQPLIVADDWVLNQAGIKYDILSGRPLSQKAILKRQGGCNYAVGTKNLLFWRQICASYVDMETGKVESLRNLRSGCSNSIVAAGGLVSVPCYSIGCVCNYPLQTSFSMYHLEAMKNWPKP